MTEFWDLFGEWGLDYDGNPLPLSVETYTAAGMLGPHLAAPRSLPGIPQVPQDRLTRGTDGNEITSATALYAPLALDGVYDDARDVFTLHSRVVPASGQPATIVGLAVADVNGIFQFLRADLA